MINNKIKMFSFFTILCIDHFLVFPEEDELLSFLLILLYSKESMENVGSEYCDSFKLATYSGPFFA
eukprot:m.29760 g.29760  ORF g.29760 m.29760 type:complete len:66 (+) comp6180_c1_seq1:60-257(+)